MTPAVQLALDSVNADPNVLHGYRLGTALFDHQCSPGLGLRGLVQVIYNATVTPLVGILDGGCSNVARTVTDLGRWYYLVSVSGVAATPILSDKSQYPVFLRTTGSFEGYAPGYLAVLNYYKWRRIATITEQQALYTMSMDAFKQLAGSSVEYVVEAAMPQGDDGVETLDRVLQAGARVVAIQTGPFVARKLFCQASKVGAVGPGRAWIIPGWFSPGWWRPRAGDPFDCTDAQMRAATQGYISIEFSGDGQMATTVAGISTDAFRSEYEASSPSGTLEFGYTLADAVWAWAFALHDLIINQGRDPYSLSQDAAGQAAVKAALYKTRFPGVSGIVQFDQGTGDRTGLYIRVENQREGTEVLVGTLDPNNTLTMSAPVVWYDSPVLANGSYANVGLASAPTDGSEIAKVVEVVMWDAEESGFGVIGEWGSRFNGKLMGSQRSAAGARAGILPVLLTTALTSGPDPLLRSFDFRLNTSIPAVDRGRDPRTYASSATSPGQPTRPTVARESWAMEDGLWVAPDLCEELLEQSDTAAIGRLRAAVVALEPSVTPGYHPCWSPDLQQVLLYAPGLGILAPDRGPLPAVLLAAVLSLIRPSVIQTTCLFFIMGQVSAFLIWLAERHRRGIYPEREESQGPAPFFGSMGDGFYWAITTGTSTGYGDLTPVTPVGRLWACSWMLLGILFFALTAGALTNEIILMTTDSGIYAFDDVGAEAKIGALGSGFYAVEHLLTTTTPVSHFTSFSSGDDAVRALRNGSLDAIIGPYPSVLEARARTIHTAGANDLHPNVFVTGPPVANERMFGLYLVYRRSHFTSTQSGEFLQRMPAAVSSARERLVSMEAVNLPLSMRGSKEPAPEDHNGAASISIFLIATLLFPAIYLGIGFFCTEGRRRLSAYSPSTGECKGEPANPTTVASTSQTEKVDEHAKRLDPGGLPRHLLNGRRNTLSALRVQPFLSPSEAQQVVPFNKDSGAHYMGKPRGTFQAGLAQDLPEA